MKRSVRVDKIGRFIGLPVTDVGLNPADPAGLRLGLREHLRRIVEPVDRRGRPALGNETCHMPRATAQVVDHGGIRERDPVEELECRA